MNDDELKDVSVSSRRSGEVGLALSFLNQAKARTHTMFIRIFVFGFLLVLCFVMPSIVSAATWEELYSSKSGEIEARVEMKKYSYRKRLTHGEKIINAHLRMYYREGATTSQATGDYEIYCAARKAFRSNLNMDVQGADRTRSTVRMVNKTTLGGKEYQDFTGLMEILCARER